MSFSIENGNPWQVSYLRDDGSFSGLGRTLWLQNGGNNLNISTLVDAAPRKDSEVIACVVYNETKRIAKILRVPNTAQGAFQRAANTIRQKLSDYTISE